MLALDVIHDRMVGLALGDLQALGQVTATLCGWRQVDDDKPWLTIAMDKHPGFVESGKAGLVRDELLANDIAAYAFASEAWAGSNPEHRGQVRHDPQAVDVIHVIAATATRVIIQGFRIKRDGAGRRGAVADQRHDTASEEKFFVSGRWATLLAPAFDPTGRTVTIPAGGEVPAGGSGLCYLPLPESLFEAMLQQAADDMRLMTAHGKLPPEQREPPADLTMRLTLGMACTALLKRTTLVSDLLPRRDAVYCVAPPSRMVAMHPTAAWRSLPVTVREVLALAGIVVAE